mgnify:CR=1 FL=1
MVELEKYIKELGEDCVFDDFSIKETQMKLPAIKHKWVGRLVTHKKILYSLKDKKKKIMKKLVDKVRDTNAYKVSIPAAEKACENHDSVAKINEDIREHELIVEFIEKCERVLSSMTYDMKNLVELMKLETL